MPSVRDVLDAIEALAPARFSFSFDRIGLQVGDPDAQVERIAVALDPTLAAVAFARERRAQMLVCHHPVIWDPMATVRYDDYKGRVVRGLVEGGVAFAAAHTNWDCAPGGINDTLAELIGLTDVRPTGSSSDKEQLKVVVFVPEEAVAPVIEAMVSAGAGTIGEYDRCAWMSQGVGTFKGRDGTNPAVGKPGEVHHEEESRVEMVCPADRLSGVIAAMREEHPYEEPAFDVFNSRTGGGHPICRMGKLPEPMSPEEFREHLDRRLDTRTLLCAPRTRAVRTVVVCGGAAADEWIHAKGVADAFVTGEVPHHLMAQGSEEGVAMAACGHYATENPGTMRLADRLAETFQVLKFEPEPGHAGRP
jgi:dinuclear metal center YbgI/SA1388 family protein